MDQVHYKVRKWKDSRHIVNPEIKKYLMDSIKDDIPNYLELFQLKSFQTFHNIPVFISRDLRSHINAVVLIIFGDYYKVKVYGHLFIHLKVENVNSFNEILDRFSWYHNPGWLDNYKIKIIEKNPYKTRSYEYGFHISGESDELPYIFEHLDQIRANDRMFYSFNEVNLQYECYNAYSLLSTDPNNKNNETLRTYKIKSELANPPYGMMFLNAWNSITSFFRSNIDRPLPIQDQPKRTNLKQGK